MLRHLSSGAMPPRESTLNGKRAIVAFFDSLTADRVDAIFGSFPYGFTKLFRNASTKSYVLVGNGPLPHYQSADIDGFDVVIGVNSWRSYHTFTGRKCDVLSPASVTKKTLV